MSNVQNAGTAEIQDPRWRLPELSPEARSMVDKLLNGSENAGVFKDYDGGWNSDVAVTNDPQTDQYSGAPRYIQPGQYGRGLLTDVVASYGGFGIDEKAEFLNDPAAVISDSVSATNPDIDLDSIIPAINTTDEVQSPGAEGDARSKKYLDSVSSSISLGKSGADLFEFLKGSAFGGVVNGLLKAGGFASAGLGIISTILPFLDKQYVYTGAGTDNAEKSQALSRNIASFGAYAQAGTETMNNQADLMEKMSAKLAIKEDGSFADAEYAYKAVNQMSLLTNNGPVFISENHVALPEMTTGKNQVDIPLPANVFSYGPGNDNSGRRDRSHALVNNSSDSTGAFDNLETVDSAIKRGGDISTEWKNRAGEAAGSGTHGSGLSARESGPTIMLNDFYGQVDQLGGAKDRYDTAKDKLKEAMSGVLDSDKWDALAEQAGGAIRKNYADQQRISSADKVQPIELVVNPKLTKDAGELSKDAETLFGGLADRASSAFDQLYSTKDGSLVADAKTNLTETWLTSGKEISPFNDRLSGYLLEMNKDRMQSKDRDTIKENFRKKVEDDPMIGGGMMNNILKDGFDFNINAPANYPKEDPVGAQTTGLTLKLGEDGKLNTDEIAKYLSITQIFDNITLTSGKQSRKDQDFYEQNKDKLSLIESKWDDWNGKDSVVSEKDLKKISDPKNNRSQEERDAASLLLSDGLLNKLDTYSKGGEKGDTKINNEDFFTWLHALEDGQGTARSADRKK